MRWAKIAILILLLAWYGLFLFHKIDLTTSDLGRHIKNGEMVLSGQTGVLTSNFYSYTEPDSTFINHHWLSGVIFYLIWKFSGFAGLHLFFIILSLAAFWLFFDIAKKLGGYILAVPAALFLIPLIAERVEARPEIFSYLFSGIFLWALWQKRWLWALPVLMLFWANLHIYFFWGLFLIFIFTIFNFKKFWPIFLASLAAIFINPFGLRVIALPLTLFQNYGYRIVENQSVRFLDNLGFIQNPNLFWFKIIYAVFILSLLAARIRQREFNWELNIAALILGVAGAFAIRNFTIFGLFALPALCANVQSVFGQGQKIRENKELAYGIAIIFSALILIISFFTHQTRLLEERNGFGLGLAQASGGSADFFKRENIKGPIFNNYDIGSYLIFHLFPKEKVFTDNRPEAYSADFFENIYVPMQEDEAIWQKENAIYNFNAIFFSHKDATPWGQKFLTERLKDPAWKQVYLDDYAIIFTKVKP